MSTLFQDLRYGARILLKQPAFTLVAVITLALGIGANTAIFSLVNSILLRPLPFREPDRVVRLIQASPELGLDTWGVSQADFAAYRDQNRSFESVALYNRPRNQPHRRWRTRTPAGDECHGRLFQSLRCQPVARAHVCRRRRHRRARTSSA